MKNWRHKSLRKEWKKLVLSFLVELSLVILFLAYACPPAEARKEARSPRDSSVISKKRGEEGLKKGKRKEKRRLEGKAVKERKPTAEELERLPPSPTPYTTTEELLLPREAGAVRRAFVSTEPLYFEGRIVQEQALFESYARREEEESYRYAIEAIEAKPWWQGLLESLSGVINYEQGYYSNYFNHRRRDFPNRRRNRLMAEKGFFGGRVVKRGVLSIDSNYFVSLERLSAEHGISLDPHVLKTHGGQARFLYRPSRRFHWLFYNEMRQTEKIVSVDDRLGSLTAAGSGGGSHVVSDRLGSQFRYFLTNKDVIDLTFNYDYSRARDGNELRIARGYQPKLSFLRAFGRRLILRGFWSYDYLVTTNKSEKGESFRHEPGLGSTLVLGKRFVLDVDYARQYLRTTGVKGRAARGNRVSLKLNHSLNRRLSHSYLLEYSKLQGKRSATSKITKEDPSTETREESPGAFEVFNVGSQFSYRLTKLTSLSVTLDYTWTDSGVPDSETNNRKRIKVELGRPIFGKRADLALIYTFEKNNAATESSYLSHTLTLGVSTKLGVGKTES